MSDSSAFVKAEAVENPDAKRRAEELRARLELRTKELMAKRNVASSSPVVVGGALVIPSGLLAKRKGQYTSLFSADASRRA